MSQKPSIQNPDDKALLHDVIDRNIKIITRLDNEARDRRSIQDRFADAITAFSGSMAFVYVHIAWFGLWIVASSGILPIPRFDPFPFGLLTMIVSLEAIFLSTFVLVSQNRTSQQDTRRANLALQIGLLTEHELTRVLQMLDAIQEKLGVEGDLESDLADLEQETRPEDVLAEIERIGREVQTPEK